ncbi:MAG: aminotransferase class V-fold PLP-dependent enzyme [Bacillota bacterium]
MKGIEAIRRDFPVLARYVYLNTGTLGPSPEPVNRRLIDLYLDWEHNGPGNPENYGHMHEATGPVRARLAAWLGVAPEELAFTANATDGVDIVAWGLDWREGDEVLISDQEHPAVFVPWLWLSKRLGIKTKVVKLSNDPKVILANVEKAIGQRTRLLSFSHVSSMTGLRLPVAELSRLCHDRGVLVMYDGAQSCGQFRVDIPATGADFYSLNGHKWMLGPVGTGAVYVRRDLQERVRPSWVGGGSTSVCDYPELGRFEFPDTAVKYEFATRPWHLHVGWGYALDYLDGLGWPEIEARVRKLASLLKERLGAIKGAQVLSPTDPTGATGLSTFSLEGWPFDRLYEALNKEHGVVGRPVWELNAVRLSTHFYNTEEEIDRAAEAVARLAQTRP